MWRTHSEGINRIITIEAQDVNLSAWSDLILTQQHIEGQSTFKAIVSQNSSQTNMDLHLNAKNLQLFDHLNQPLHDLVQSIQLHANMNGEKKELDIHSQFAHDKPLLVHLASDPSLDTFSGYIKWQTSQLQWLSLLDIESPKGILDTDIQLSGTMDRPSIQGAISVNHGQFYIPFLNLTLEDTNTQINLNKNQLHLTGSTKSGGGLLELNAQGTWVNQVLLVDGKINGQDVLVVNSPDLMIYASPKLQWTLKNSHLDIQGTADIPKAEIKFQNFDNIATLPDETTLMNQQQARTPNFSLSYNLNLLCGNNVLANTYGIKGGVSGNLLLHKYPFDEPQVDGQLKLLNNAFYQK